MEGRSMPRIPERDIERLKAEIGVERLVEEENDDVGAEKSCQRHRIGSPGCRNATRRVRR